jgi:excinuclease ABC subunit C
MNNDLPAHLNEKLAHLSPKPGVYLFKDVKGEIIYIGKAKILKNRVRSYFQPGRILDAKQLRMVMRVHDLETIITDSEVEALILEANLVKEHKPRYNINLKDDKSFPYIRVTHEPFPRIFPTRRIIRDGSRYYGPYTDVDGMRAVLKTVRRMFLIRSCKLNLTTDTIQGHKFTVCLDYHIKRCHGPCEGHISQQEYNQNIEYVIKFVQGRTGQIEEEMRTKIQTLAAALRFEEAARLRDQLNLIHMFQQRQKVVDQSMADRDMIAMAREEDDSCCVLFKIREGKIIARQHFYLTAPENESDGAVLTAFLQQYYLKAQEIPREILLSHELGEELETIKLWLSQKRNEQVLVWQPKRGEKSHLMRLCERNARLLLDELKIQKEKSKDYTVASVKALQKDLFLEKSPRRIEAFDISNIQGADAVASMVCFVNGKPHKSDYRRFRIRGKSSPDDFAMMHEAVKRRFGRLLHDKIPLPDLVLIDGGKGQLSAALKALEELDIKDQPVIALAKRLDEVFAPGDPEPRNIRRDSAGLRLLQRIRDESHRFAVTYHRLLRKKRTLVSILQEIPGIGPGRRDVLIKKFGSLKKIKQATVTDLSAIEGISKPLAETIVNFFQSLQDSAG